MSEFSFRSEQQDDWAPVEETRKGHNLGSLDPNLDQGIGQPDEGLTEVSSVVEVGKVFEDDDEPGVEEVQRSPEVNEVPVVEPPAPETAEVDAPPGRGSWAAEIEVAIAQKTAAIRVEQPIDDLPQSSATPAIDEKTVREGMVDSQVVPVDRSREHSPAVKESVHPSGVQGELNDWFSEVETPTRDAHVDSATMAVAVVVAEVSQKSDVTVTAEVEDDLPEIGAEKKTKTLFDKAVEADNPDAIRQMIVEAQPEEGSVLDVFMKTDPKEFVPPKVTPKDFFAGMQLTQVDPYDPEKAEEYPSDETYDDARYEGGGEVGEYLRMAHPRAEGDDMRALASKMARLKTAHDLEKRQEVSIDKAKGLFEFKMRRGKTEDALELARQLVESQNRLLPNKSRLAQLDAGEEIPRESEVTTGAEQRWELYKGLRYTLLREQPGGDADAALLEDHKRIVELRGNRRALEAMHADPEAWKAGARDYRHSEASAKDAAELAALTLATKKMHLQNDVSTEDLVRGIVDEHVGSAAWELYREDPRGMFEGEMPKDVQALNFEKEVQITHVTYRRMLQDNPTAARRYLSDQTIRLSEVARGAKEYQTFKEDPNAFSKGSFPFTKEELATRTYDDIVRLRIEAERRKGTDGSTAGVSDPQLDAYYGELLKLEAAWEADDGTLAARVEREKHRFGKRATSELFPARRTLVVDGSVPANGTKPGPLVSYVSKHGNPEDIIEYHNPPNYRDWTRRSPDDARVKKVPFVPNADHGTYEAVFYEGLVPATCQDPEQILRRTAPGGVSTLQMQYNPDLAQDLLGMVAAEQSPFYGDYRYLVVPSPNLEFITNNQAPGGRGVYQGEENGWTLLLFRNQEDGSPSPVYTELENRSRRQSPR